MTESSTYSATVVRGTWITTGAYVFTQVITIAFYVVLARLAGPSVFGAFAAAWIIVGVSTFLTESGMSSALIQRNDRLDEAAATAVVSTFATGLGLSLIALALAPLVGLYFHDHEIGLLSAALAGVCLVNSATVVPDALMRRRFAFVRRVVVDPLNAGVYGLVGVVTLSLGMGAWGLVIATYAAGVVRVVSVWVFNRWLPDLRKASLAMWRELARYARHVALGELLREVSEVTNTAIVGRFLGIAPLGAFRFGLRMASEASIPVATSAYMLFPAFARIADDRSRFQRGFLRAARPLSAVIFPVSVALLVLGPQIGVALLGERWREAGHVLAALAGLTLATVFIQLAAEVFKAANRPQLLPRMTFVRSVGSIVLMIAFVPLGVVGVSVGVSLGFLLSAAYGWRAAGKVLSLPPRQLYGVFVAPALASGAMGVLLGLFAAYLVELGDATTFVRWAWLGLELALATIVYLVLLFSISRSSYRELKDFLRRVRSRNKGPTEPATTATEPAAVEKAGT